MSRLLALKYMKGKVYTEIATGNVVKVLDNFEDIVILDNKEKIKSSRLLDRRFYEEYIDPKNFFSNQSIYDTLASKIKSIPTDQLRDDDNGPITESVSVDRGDNQFKPVSNESAVIYDDPEEEKRILQQKAIDYARLAANNVSKGVNKQAELLSKFADEEANDIVPPNFKVVEPIQQTNERKVEVKVDNIEQNITKSTTIHQETTQKNNLQQDPVIQMFKNVKRNINFNIKIDVSNKIPRLDFIEMMEDSYEVSIIDFLADEFTEKIINDPDYIKRIIKEGIEDMISENKENVIKTTKKQAIKKDISDKIIKPKKQLSTKTKKRVEPQIPENSDK